MRPIWGAPAANASSSAGMKAGSFWPSPSRVTMMPARAWRTPLHTAADCPHEVRCLLCRSHGRLAISSVNSDSVRSVEPSLTSKLGPLPSAAAISSTSGAMLPASLRTGATIETAGGAALASVSLMICATWPRHGRLASWLSASFLWGDKLPGNPFDACERGTGQWPNDSILAEHEGKPARRVPIAHQQRADRAGDGPHHDVARKV